MTISEFIVSIKGDSTDLTNTLAKSKQGLTSLNNDVKKTNSAFEILKSTVGKITLAIGAVAGVMKAAQVGNEANKVATAFNNIATAAGASGSEIVSALEKASQGSVSTVDIMKSSSQAIKLMGSEVIKDLPKLMEMAVVSAATTGADVTQTFNDIINAAGRQSIEILDNVGISAVTTRKYIEEYAQSQGKTTEKLDAAGKKAAFFYAVNKAGGEMISQQGKDVKTLVSGYDQLKTSLENLGTTAATTASGPLNSIFVTVSNTLNRLGMVYKQLWGTEEEGLNATLKNLYGGLEQFNKQGETTFAYFSAFNSKQAVAARARLEEIRKARESFGKPLAVEGDISSPTSSTAEKVKKDYLDRLYKDRQDYFVKQQQLAGTNYELAKVNQQKAFDYEIKALQAQHSAEYAESVKNGDNLKNLQEAQGLEMAALRQAQSEQAIGQFGATSAQYRELAMSMTTTMMNMFSNMAQAIQEGNLKTLAGFKQFTKDFLIQMITMVEGFIAAIQIKNAVWGIGNAPMTFGASLAASATAAAAIAPYFAAAEVLKAGVRAMATGGIVTSPTMALIGEGRDNEAVLPLNDKTFGALAMGINNAQAATGGNTSFESNRTINVVLDGKVIGSAVDNYRDQKASKMGASNYSFQPAY